MIKCATIVLNYEELDVVFTNVNIVSIMNNTTGEYYNIANLSNESFKQIFVKIYASQINNVV